jgi:hypothetical protein
MSNEQLAMRNEQGAMLLFVMVLLTVNAGSNEQGGMSN